MSARSLRNGLRLDALLEGLKRELASLRLQDEDPAWSPPLSSSEARALERRLGVRLPEPYSRLLLEVTAGIPGVLLSPTEMSERFPSQRAAAPFPFTEAQIADAVAAQGRGELPCAGLRGPAELDGVLPLEVEESGIVVMALAGPRGGELWHVSSAGWLPRVWFDEGEVAPETVLHLAWDALQGTARSTVWP